MEQQQINEILEHGSKKLMSLVPTPRGKTLHVGDYYDTGLLKYHWASRSYRSDMHDWYNVVSVLSSKLSDSKKRASKMNFDFDLDLKYLCNLWIEQKGVCAITKHPLEYTTGTSSDKNPLSISIDRIDNSCGYVKGNVRLLTHWANNAKSTWSTELFERMIKFSAQHLAKD
jgi:hypothetical protein